MKVTRELEPKFHYDYCGYCGIDDSPENPLNPGVVINGRTGGWTCKNCDDKYESNPTGGEK